MIKNPFKIGDCVKFTRGDWSPDDMIVVDTDGIYVTVAHKEKRDICRDDFGRIYELDHLFVHLELKGK